MVEVFKLNLDIVRKRFKIYGFFNIVSLLLVISIILGGVKIGQALLGHYDKLSLMMLTIVYVLFAQYIFPSRFKENVEKIKTYFNILSLEKIEKYYMYKN